MHQLEVTERIQIAADAETVRRQFADVGHHAAAGVHNGVVFEVITEDANHCRYRQTARVGPLRFVQILELDRGGQGPLVNRVVEGQFHGGTITFDITGDTAAEVTATLDAPLRGPQRLIAGLLRRNVAASLRRALAEDKHDLESGTYR